MIRIIVQIVFLFLSSLTVQSQVVKGKVQTEMGAPLVYAHVLNDANGEHTHTNERGEFTIEKCQIGDTLRTSYVGFRPQMVIVNDSSEFLLIIMEGIDLQLDEVVISSEVDAMSVISEFDIQQQPMKSSQDVLRIVPGLFIGQHAGGGKAEQIFLRGFDIDHGTDLALSVDGLPVNMVSHAHGQGYADLHFVIPETIERVNLAKGPYSADVGNFGTAGDIQFITKKRLDQSVIKSEIGQFDTRRILAMTKLIDSQDHHFYVASEFMNTDGPFDSPQRFGRLNLMGKYTGIVGGTDNLGVTISRFSSQWDASGQIPQRAVNRGLIGRFGAIDDTEGGSTSRTNLLVDHLKFINEKTTIRSRMFASFYDFDLYSNFTFFLEDSINGDQIRQEESRNIYGLHSEVEHELSETKAIRRMRLGMDLRYDAVQDNALSRTVSRQPGFGDIQRGDVRETNTSLYTSIDIVQGKWSIVPAIRFDHFDFEYQNALSQTLDRRSEFRTIVSPKIQVAVEAMKDLKLYAKVGRGFHSNDSRVVIEQTADEILPAVSGADVGATWKPTKEMLFDIAFWVLDSEQEFVYVGDAGIVEPSGQSQRQGVDMTLRYQPIDFLSWSLDVNYAMSRLVEEDPENDRIPLAPSLTAVSRLNYIHNRGFRLGMSARHMANRPANEDNSIVAEGYTILDLNLGYEIKSLSIGVQVENLLDADWNETQFATESRLQNETQSVEEIHFTPGTPFFLKGSIAYRF